ncbi:hypothetical protein Tco_1286953 [Tanacetum coccineum]
MKLDLEARLMGEALIFNRSLDSMGGDYIQLNDLNEPLELRRNQVEDFGPMIEDGEIINEPMENVVKTRNDNEKINGINEYPSFCDSDRKIYIDYDYNLQFSYIIDAYQDQDMGQVIVGKLFCKATCVEARRFDRMITIYNGNDSVTYQMAHSHPRHIYAISSLMDTAYRMSESVSSYFFV